MVQSPTSEVHLTEQAQSLWAKSDYGIGQKWLPLYVHVHDSYATAKRLWNNWLPEGTKTTVAASFDGNTTLAEKIVCFLTGVHDIGKCTPIFQATPCGYGPDAIECSLRFKPERAGLPFDLGANPSREPKHTIAGQVILERYLRQRCKWEARLARSYASVLGCHHGTPPEEHSLRKACKCQPCEMGYDASYGNAWISVQEELIEYALNIAGMNEADLKLCASHMLAPQAASIITGIVIMSDWIASNNEFFPLISIIPQSAETKLAEGKRINLDALRQRADEAWKRAGISPCWKSMPNAELSANELYRNRFDLPQAAAPYPIQAEALRIARETAEPGLLIIEAPMGEGKTEAALAAAEVLAARRGRGGVCVALPTMATTDAMFGRVHAWLEKLVSNHPDGAGSMYLAHGKARLNDEYQGIVHSSQTCKPSMGEDLGSHAQATQETAYVSSWMQGRKKGMLANFLVCTIDQVLMAGLGMKHLPLRHLALANKVVIIDECHAYDAYMREYLNCVLGWLGCWDVPVILLSATLPGQQRADMIRAYREGQGAAAERPSRPNTGEEPAWRKKRRLQQAVGSETGVEQSQPIDAECADAYPLLTYTDGNSVQHKAVSPSSRATALAVSTIADTDEALASLLNDLLAEGGVAGIVCNTVRRAQSTAAALAAAIPDARTMLTHSRFMDIDRMANETALREMLGPQATAANGARPEKAIIVGTQVLEQSLDIDFDVMVTDIAPTDLLMQRIGRLHRHKRGHEESQRPEKLRNAQAYIRGIDSWKDEGPCFARGIASVYPEASLLEACAVLGITCATAKVTVKLPEDIATTVRTAYSNAIADMLPYAWLTHYGEAATSRDKEVDSKRGRAGVCRIPPIACMCHNQRTLTGWYQMHVGQQRSIADRTEEQGQRAVRDAQESVEVLLLEERDKGIYLLPWVCDEALNVPPGTRVPTEHVPEPNVAKVAIQCAVRLPISICVPDHIDALIDELEAACSDRIAAWQESYWLAGQLPLLLHKQRDGSYSTELQGFAVGYSQREGLTVSRVD